uniref:CCHC-type domain-containing protein n=1 Tax=Fagus sylvatica TaxID=28930 RepID=A0A2N9FR12_FAGSY
MENDANRGLHQFEKLNPLSFNGEPDPMIAEKCVMRVEKIFEALGCSEEQKVVIAIFKLEGEAEHWWKMTKTGLEAKGKPLTWTNFLEAFYEKYFPDSVRDQKELEFQQLEHKDLTIGQYETKFTELARFAPHLIEEDSKKAKKFLPGLRPPIRSKLVPLLLDSYSKVVRRALAIEKDWEENHKQKNQQGGTRGNTPKGRREFEPKGSNKRAKKAEPKKVPPLKPVGPYGKCGKNHDTKDCRRVSGACFRCGKMGYLIKDCPMQAQQQQEKPKVHGRVFAITQQDA